MARVRGVPAARQPGARAGARSSGRAREDCGEQAGVCWPVDRPPKRTPRGAAPAVPRRPRLDTLTHAARASREMGCASVRGAPPRRRSRSGSRHTSRLATRPATTVVAKRGGGGSWRVRRGGRLCDCSAGDALPVEGCGAPARGGLGCGWLCLEFLRGARIDQLSRLARSETVRCALCQCLFSCKERLYRDVITRRLNMMPAKRPGFKIDCARLTGAEGADRRRCL